MASVQLCFVTFARFSSLESAIGLSVFHIFLPVGRILSNPLFPCPFDFCTAYLHNNQIITYCHM